MGVDDGTALPLNAPLFRRPAAIMGQRSDVFDRFDRHAGSLQGGNCAFASASRPLDAHLQFPNAELGCLFRTLLGGHLAGEGRTLAASLKTAGARAGPAQSVTLGIGDGHACVVERGLDVGNTHRHVPPRFTTLAFCHLRLHSLR
jgi:hypothetical protein